jgi:hypothetical protein
VAGAEKDRNWEKEMAEVDRLLRKQPSHADPAADAGAEPTARRPAAVPPAAAPAPAPGPAGLSGAAWLGTWARVILGLLLGIGMTQWPYTHGCGLRLIFYLVGVAAVLAAGVWSSVSSWRRRLGLAHVLAQALIIWGLVLAAREVLPRVGYARASAPWLCPDVPAPR